MRFSELLNSYIEKSDMTKNSMINVLNIDRSTFFQILNGRRLPTNKQLMDIVENIDVATVERRRLIDAYERETLGEDMYQAQKFVQNSLDIIYESDYKEKDISISVKTSGEKDDKTHVTGKSSVKKYLRQLIIDELTTGGSIDIFTPISLMVEMDLFQILSLMCSSEEAHNTPIRQLVEFPVRNIFTNSESISVLGLYLEFLLNQNLDYHAYYYYADSNLSTRMGVFYPYYMIFSNRVILLNVDGDELIDISDTDINKAWRANFEEILNSADSLVSSFDKKEEYVALLGQRGNKTLYIFEKRPGISFMMTKEFMDKYIPKPMHEMIYAHVNCFIQSDYVEIISSAGAEAFFADKCIDEAGFKLQAEEQDVMFVKEWMKERLHNTLEILDAEKMPLSDNWSISVIEDECLILVPYLSNDKIIYVSEKNIVKAFTNFAKNISSAEVLLDDEKTTQLLKN